jgi:hypothetical protein
MDSQPITVAAQSNAWTVFARSNTGIVGSNPTWFMDVWLPIFCVCVLRVGSALWRTDPPSKKSYRLYKRSRNWKTAKFQRRTAEPQMALNNIWFNNMKTYTVLYKKICLPLLIMLLLKEHESVKNILQANWKVWVLLSSWLILWRCQ